MQMAREEAKKYKDELVDRYYKKKISWDEYNKLWDEIKLLPYDLSMFPQLKEKTITWINTLFQEPPETNRRGNYMLRGFTRYEGNEMAWLGLSYGDYADAISFYAYNDEEMLVYEFTEGDTTLQIFNDVVAYEKEKESMRLWYREERSA